MRGTTFALACAFAAVAVGAVVVLAVVGLDPTSGGTMRADAPDRQAGPPGSSQRHLPRPELFAADSVWNRAVPSDAAIDRASDRLVRTLRATVAQRQAWIAWRNTSPLYRVRAHQSTVRVQLDTGAWGATLQRAFEKVPMPEDAVPAGGPDRHLTIWQPSTDRLWEFFHASKRADGWHAEWGGAIDGVSRSPGYYRTDSWPGLSQPYWGATATSLPVIAGTMMLAELKSGVIPHALAMNIRGARSNVYSWPAQRTDGSSSNPQAIPEGAHFRIDPALDIDRLELPPLARMMAITAQRYGIIVRDQTEGVAFFAENTTQFGTDPYTADAGFYGGLTPGRLLRDFPWQRLQLLKMDLRTMR